MEIQKHNFWSTPDPIYDLLELRGKAKRDQHLQVVKAGLSLMEKPVTKDQLQRVVRIKRAQFIKVFTHLVSIEVIIRSGTGMKGDPFVYVIADRHRVR